MKIAIASSGLGHVFRGVEAWAFDTAEALVGKNVDVTLFAAGKMKSDRLDAEGRLVVLPCVRRNDKKARHFSAMMPPFAWRWGLKTEYGWEQASFWRHLWPQLAEGRFDILHVQDPMLAFWCRKCRKLGLVKTVEILAHGTEEPVKFLAQFDHVQHLTPWHLNEALAEVKHIVNRQRLALIEKEWSAIPNFIDTSIFSPDGRSESLRTRFGIPAGSFVVGTAATVKRGHKRIDYLIQEFAELLRGNRSCLPADPYLLIAGGGHPDSKGLIEMAERLCGDRVKIVLDIPRNEMPDFYRSLDVFVLASVFEMMPISVLEAMASGLPVIVHKWPSIEWMKGEEAGASIDMSRSGELAGCLADLKPEWVEWHGRQARERAVNVFSKEKVIKEYIAYYEQIMQNTP